ncbi:MAG: redox-regulated ATPase YchF [Aigarchaeota archaeon]|nr:redox-regulated ATPase YchF [Aigarchaeota archaeon]MCX8192325.1 redox-regulated ATPase YchF [Nitrososphaeria archaeon]MDW7986849.1 redox-regulated ATPase YchF [Nitrososphaerota archaeon]
MELVNLAIVKVGLIGKTNTGKTTFFNAATLESAEVSTYPFTTKQPNYGKANVTSPCVCREFEVKDNPRNSTCIDGWRYIPIELIDLPGLIKGAWAGKGLGNQFLSVASQSDVLLHVVDASGSIDEEGRLTEPGTGNPIADYYDIEEELVMWLMKLIEKNDDKIIKNVKSGKSLSESMAEILRGVKITEQHIEQALEIGNLKDKDFENWTPLDDKNFAQILRELAKPTIVVANKIDLDPAPDNFEKLRDQLPDKIVVPCSAEAELSLRRAEQKGLIKYIPGQETFEIIKMSGLTDKQKWALDFIAKRVLGEYMRTGVQFAINVAVFKVLKMNTIYPVYDPQKLSDKHGNILPDVLLLPDGSTVENLAREIHTELTHGLLYAIDARTGLRLPVNYKLKDRDVLSIYSTTRRG